MSYFSIVAPTVESDGDRQRITHPAYAQIGASRVSGHAVLYGSEFNHQHYVSIRIKTSEHIRSLSNDWHHGRRELIEVCMSEAQWASFVSSMNVGDGPCCTLHHFDGSLVPQPPEPKQTTEHFRKELAQVHADVQAVLNEIAGALSGAIGKRTAEDLQHRLRLAAGRLTGSAGYVADQFDEHMEATTEKAKIEVNAFVEAAVRRAGLQSIADGSAVLSLPPTKLNEGRA